MEVSSSKLHQHHEQYERLYSQTVSGKSSPWGLIRDQRVSGHGAKEFSKFTVIEHSSLSFPSPSSSDRPYMVSGPGCGTITKRNLIVNYLPQTFTDTELYNMFIPFGALDSVRIMRDMKTGYSFGFGFVNFTTEEEAIVAQESMNGFQIASKKIKVSFARPPSDDIKDTNLYITNLPRGISEEELVDIFKPFGPIIQQKLLRDKYTNLPRGVAFIRYERREQASEAINKLNNTIPSGCAEPVRIRLAEDHGKQKAAYLAGFQAGMVVPRPQDVVGKWKGNKAKSRSKGQSQKKQYLRH